MNFLEFSQIYTCLFFFVLQQTHKLWYMCVMKGLGARLRSTYVTSPLHPQMAEQSYAFSKNRQKRLAKIGTESVQQHYCTVLRKGKRENSFQQMLCLTSGERALLSASNRVLFAPDKSSPGTLQKKEYFDSSLM